MKKVYPKWLTMGDLEARTSYRKNSFGKIIVNYLLDSSDAKGTEKISGIFQKLHMKV